MLKQKFDEVKYGKFMLTNQTNDVFAPLIEPLKDIKTKVSQPSVHNNYDNKFIQNHYNQPDAMDNEKVFETERRLLTVKAGLSDRSYGLYCKDDKFYMGDTVVEITNNVMRLPNNKKYLMTDGLWHLLTSGKPSDSEYNAYDLNTYKELVLYTYVYKQGNNPESKRPKSNNGSKYIDIIKPIYESTIEKDTDKYKYNTTPGRKLKKGKGLTKIVNTKDHNTEYVYWNSLDELLERLTILHDYIERRDRKYVDEFIPKPVVDGKGLINSLIDNLPVPLHLPGYNYAGPGTPLDLHLERGVKPINKLDEAAMKHDIAYSKSEALNQRHDADFVLQEEAWKRVKADDSSFGEKANAWLVTNTMKVKRAIGAGVSKPRYTEYPGNLDENDLEKLKKAANGRKGLTITFKCNRTKESIAGDIRIPLTVKQMRGVKTAHSKKQDAKVRLSSAQLKYMATTEGGFLPALLAAVPAIAAVGSLITQGVSAYNNKKANDKLVEERKRHNKVMEESTVGKSTEGKGIYILKKPTKAEGEGVGVAKKKKVALTNFDIVKTVKSIKMPYFRGVYMRDGLPAKPMINKRAVVNLDSSKGRGTHWVCYSKKGNTVEYFDSFGVEPPKDIIDYFGKKLVYEFADTFSAATPPVWFADTFSTALPVWFADTEDTRNVNPNTPNSVYCDKYSCP
ncbi:hypothetical protein V9T40_001004 [Parthenolecanium corni]|uniref:Uncharacterized protein n=1 Tax=Parthenolecanium corni TaxID=536013 RepID=A0AAN9Y268_9HEMI